MKYILITVFLFISFQARGQGTVCGDRENIVPSLIDDYDESRVSIGLSAEGSIFEIFASDTGSWTLIVTQPSGITCLIGTGTNFETISLPRKGLKL